MLLDAAIEQGNRNLLQLRLHPLWRSYSEDPRYLRALKKVQDDIAAQRERAIENGWLVGPGQKMP